jgi:hypothetical protein
MYQRKNPANEAITGVGMTTLDPSLHRASGTRHTNKGFIK